MKKLYFTFLLLLSVLFCFVSCDDNTHKSKITPLTPEAAANYIIKCTIANSSPSNMYDQTFFLKAEDDTTSSNFSNRLDYYSYSDKYCTLKNNDCIYFAEEGSEFSIWFGNDLYGTINLSNTNWTKTAAKGRLPSFVYTNWEINPGTYEFPGNNSSLGSMTVEVKKKCIVSFNKMNN